MPYTYGTPEWEEAYVKQANERMKTQTKPYIFFMPEFLLTWEKVLKEDAVYKEVAKDWEGSVVLVVQKKPEYGFEQDIYVWMDLWHGDCRSIRNVPDHAGKKGAFVINGSVERWMAVARKQLDPVKGMMQGKLKLKGDLPTIVRAIKAALRLVETVGMVGGKLPDEWSPAEIEQVRTVLKNLGGEFGIT
jgi:putative sterol carrier protein